MHAIRNALALAVLGACSLAAGAATPGFTLPARAGGTLSLEQLKGQVVMVNFWATWCGPCRQEMPLLEQIQQKYEPLGFTVVGINVEPDSAAAQAWLTGVDVTFPVLFDRENTVAAAFGVEGMPSTVFIDRSGAVRYVHRGYKPGDESKYSDMIRSLVKE